MLKPVLLVLLALAIAIGAGAGSVWTMLETAPPVGTLRVGPWVAFPLTGSPEADPYSRARFARQGGAPLGRAEGIAFIASQDSGGTPLTRACTYRIEGNIPSARFWTLHAIDHNGVLLRSYGRRRPALHSQTVLYSPGGEVAITISNRPASGNWLAVAGRGSMQLVLTLLDTPASTGLQAVSLNLPQILRVRCDG